MPGLTGPVAVAEIVRSGFVEGHHYGSVVALDAAGAVDWSVGDVTSPVLPRSCNKPVQALGMLRLGLELEPELLALACASHSGEDFHVAGVRRILADAGLDESALQTPPDYPLDDAARERVIRAGGEKAPVLMNCSGKHAAMLATCVRRGWDVADYRSADAPAPGRDPRGLRGAHGRAGRRGRGRRVRRTTAVDVARRAGAGVRPARPRRRRPGPPRPARGPGG